MPSVKREEIVVKTVNAMLDSSTTIVGSTAPCNELNNDSKYEHSQISSHGERLVLQDGLVMAICCPSVVVSHAFFSCYEVQDRSFSVTKAYCRHLFELDEKSAVTSLHEVYERSCFLC